MPPLLKRRRLRDLDDRQPDMPTLEFRGVTTGYGKVAVLTDLNLRIMPGDFLGLLGPSGSGKSTLLQTILGATDVLSGQILSHGKPSIKGFVRAGYVPQLDAIDRNFPVTVEQVVMMGLTRSNAFFPWFRRNLKESAHHMMARLGIAGLAKRHIRQLSGGQLQRTFLARALVSNPELLLLDEPTADVDVKTRDDVMQILFDINSDGVTILLTTHRINGVAVSLPRIICISGTIIADGPPDEVITTEVLSRVYGAEMPVVEYNGMKLVAESSRFWAVSNAAPPESNSDHPD